VYGVPSRDEKAIATSIGVHAFFVKDYLNAAKRYSYSSIEKIILLLHHYNLKSIGINDSGTSDAMLLKEMAVKIMAD
jgi:DNA polymerase-3 subunit delta